MIRTLYITLISALVIFAATSAKSACNPDVCHHADAMEIASSIDN